MKIFFKLDWVLLSSVFLLIAIGLITLYSMSSFENGLESNYFLKQLVAVGIGIFLMLFFSFLDYRVLISYSTKLYFGAILILVGLLIWGATVRGTTGWIKLGLFNLQPVEITKLILIIFLASFLAIKKTYFSITVRIIASVVLVSVPIILILQQPDFGSSVIIMGVWLIMIFVSGMNKKTIAGLVIAGIIASSSGWFMLKNYQKERLINFVNPERDPLGSGYNVIQSIVAVGSGGMWGKGLGHGSQSQLNFLPEKHTDFIFAVFAEEFGFFGSAVVLVLFGILFYRLKEAARLARDNFGYLMVVGISTMLFMQVLVNVGMNIGIAPVTGVPLPFLSYGGSSMMIILTSIGIIQSIFIRRIKSF